MQAYARTLRYLYAPIDSLEASPDAPFFPGVPPAGTQPTASPVTQTVSTSACCWPQVPGGSNLEGTLGANRQPIMLLRPSGCPACYTPAAPSLLR